MKTLKFFLYLMPILLAPMLGHATIIQSPSHHTSILELTIESQLHQRGVGLDLFEDLEFVTQDFYGMKKQKLTGKGVSIAVIDSGINFNSPYLSDNVFFGDSSVDSGREDFGYGYDFLDKNVYPYDESGSGTHSAGVIKSIAKEVTIIPVKVLDEYRFPEVSKVFSAIKYAVQKGAKIVKFSLERIPSFENRNLLLRLLKEEGFLNNDKILFVISGVGREVSLNTGSIFPADNAIPEKFKFEANNILSVCAIDKFGKTISPLTFQDNEVDVCALGKDVYSFSANGITLEKRDGSDVAASFVSGLAALLLQIQSNLTSFQVKTLIKSSVIKTPELQAFSKSGGYISIDNALDKILK